MPAYLHTVATALPETVYPQAVIRDVIGAQPELDRLGKRLVSVVFNASGIDQRYSAVPDFQAGTEDGLFYDHAAGRMLTPSTGTRNEVYIRQVTPLFVRAAQQALADSGFLAADITHVITVSCTGFFAPGPDYAVVRGLGLNPTTQRFHIGFMGCYAAFPALKMAQAFCEASLCGTGLQATVLVICAELCTLHMHSASDPDTIIANSVFADGCAAAVISARAPQAGQKALRLDQFETTLTPPETGERDMAWTIGDQGYDMVLSTYVPDIIESHLHGALEPLLAHLDDPAAGVGDLRRSAKHWAVHPGGRSILDKVQGSLGLTDEQMRPSREVLRRYGNMSSATVLFIIGEILQQALVGERVGAMAFGPGLTVESALFTQVAAPLAPAESVAPTQAVAATGVTSDRVSLDVTVLAGDAG